MKKISVVLLLLCAIVAQGQDFDDAKSRYEHDSVFTLMLDDNFHSYADLKAFTVFGNTFTKLAGIEWRDYAWQPYEILHQRDSLIFNIDGEHGLDTGVLHLDPVIGLTKSGACFFTIVGSTGSRNESISINNLNSNAYEASLVYGWKFRYWYFADKFGLTIR